MIQGNQMKKDDYSNKTKTETATETEPKNETIVRAKTMKPVVDIPLITTKQEGANTLLWMNSG